MNAWFDHQPWTLAQQPTGAPAGTQPSQVNVVGLPEQAGATPTTAATATAPRSSTMSRLATFPPGIITSSVRKARILPL